MSKSGKPLIELVLAREGIKVSPERLSEITASFDSIGIKTMNKYLFNMFMEMWIDVLIKEKDKEQILIFWDNYAKQSLLK
jgi:hypothetical protein